MRITQSAELQFRQALATAADDEIVGDDHQKKLIFHQNQGLIDLSVAIRQTFDKLSEMDRKLDALIQGAARGFK